MSYILHNIVLSTQNALPKRRCLSIYFPWTCYSMTSLSSCSAVS